MPVGEAVSVGASPASNAVACSRKEKKKQAKEERDRLKQVEKKKRRLEKALATAAAMRIELEKKKQKRKEEEQRLDEEGAALAEAVALRVLVDEDSDVVGKNGMCTASDGLLAKDDNETSSAENKVEEGVVGLGSVGNVVGDSSQPFALKQIASYKYPAIAESQTNTPEEFLGEWEVSVNRVFEDNRGEKWLVSQELLGEKGELSNWDLFTSTEDKLKASNERAKAAEMAAGIAAAQAVAALRIAEEARAEAEAAKKAAEAAMSQVLDRQDMSQKPDFSLEVKVQSRSIEMERDELKARLEETERQLKEKTRQVVHLEQNLEDMAQYLLELKSKIPTVVVGLESEGQSSERESATVTESSAATVDQ